MSSPVQGAPASLSFDPSETSVKVGQAVKLNVNMYTDNASVASVDVMINYDKGFFEPVLDATVNGSTFQKVDTKIIKPGTIYLYGIQEDKESTQPVQGHIASVTFKALKEGTTQITFGCDPVKNTTSQIIKSNEELENIISCTSTLSHTANITIDKGSVLGTYADTYTNVSPLTAIFGILVAVFTFFVFLKYQKLKKGIS